MGIVGVNRNRLFIDKCEVAGFAAYNGCPEQVNHYAFGVFAAVVYGGLNAQRYGVVLVVELAGIVINRGAFKLIVFLDVGDLAGLDFGNRCRRAVNYLVVTRQDIAVSITKDFVDNIQQVFFFAVYYVGVFPVVREGKRNGLVAHISGCITVNRRNVFFGKRFGFAQH